VHSEKTKDMKTKAGSTRFPGARSTRRSAHVNAAPSVAPRVKISSILVPTDFSEASKTALKYAARFADRFGAKLAILHVVEPVATPDFAYYPLMMENDKAVAKAHKELGKFAGTTGLQAPLLEKTLVRTGVAFNEISKAAESLKVDLIIISTHGYTGLKRVLLGSTTERVVRHAKCPVLVVRNR
jgi:nucleotide-binding universal stress UspA family protein